MKEKIKKFLTIVFLIVFIVSITYIISYFYTGYKDKKDLKELKDIMKVQELKNLETTEVTNQNDNELNSNENNSELIMDANNINQEKNISSNFEELKKVNEDIVAWVRIDDTDIDYPILQAKDNDYYLDRNYKKEYSRNGSIFLDYRYDFSKDNQVFLVYGHNNNDKMMFNELLKYEKEDFFEKHKKIELITEDESSLYNIISIFKSEVYSKDETNIFKYYNFIDLSNQEVFNYYVKNIRDMSVYKSDENIEYGDELLVLSTCEYSKQNGRFVVVAVKENKWSENNE